MEKKEQYIYKDGRYLKISGTGGGGSADIELVQELPEVGSEKKIYLIEHGTGPTPTPSISSLITLITYNELKTLRDSSQLIPGMSYRITDYNCTTTQEDTKSAGHQFDIIVIADDVNKLNENARAIQHEGDTYFEDSELAAWDLKYSLDNNNSRFLWADVNTGKGIIYYMKDEWNNECAYDFKNIQFKRKLTNGQYDPDNGSDTWVYTFTWVNQDNIVEDLSFMGNKLKDDEWLHQGCHDNYIGECYKYWYPEHFITSDVVFTLSNNCFISSYSYDSGFFYGTYGIKLSDNCYSNTFGNSCNNNIFVGNLCRDNIFGNYCSYNTFGNVCDSNTFGNDCGYNTFGNVCSSNTFGNDCSRNTFGNNCSSNTFGNNCSSNTFGNSCGHDNFGDSCRYNTFGNNCHNNTLAQTGDYLNYAQYNIFENSVQYVDLQATSSDSGYLQNIKICQGVCGTYDNIKVITEARNLDHQVTYRTSGYEDKTI